MFFPQDWQLSIKFVQLRDAGFYECAVSSHPSISLFVQLDVTESKAEIAGPAEKYLKPGSTLRLTCRVLENIESPIFLFWYHNSRMINYDSHLGINVTIELGEDNWCLRTAFNWIPSLNPSDNKFSELVIVQTTVAHSGNYTCFPSNAAPASVLVHIFNGKLTRKYAFPIAKSNLTLYMLSDAPRRESVRTGGLRGCGPPDNNPLTSSINLSANVAARRIASTPLHPAPFNIVTLSAPRTSEILFAFDFLNEFRKMKERDARDDVNFTESNVVCYRSVNNF